MRGELVALDLETTGLDPLTDAIIEIGAVRMKDGVIIDEFSTMVDPQRPIPSQITYITGIREEDITGAPTVDRVLPQLSEFVQDAPVIAHNVDFDMSFLQGQHRILLSNARIDTYELASVLMPRAPRYNLNSLTQQTGIALEHAHRALDDARGAALLYWELWQKALSLPHSTLREIGNAARGLDWDAAIVFRAALQESTTASQEQLDILEFDPPDPNLRPLHANETTQMLDPDTVTAIAYPGGELSRHMAHFEARPQQVEMVRAITEAFNKARHLIVEAGTGTGKSIAYLIPAILWSVKNNKRVVISTNTINLQDQLINNDIPLLRAALGVEFSASVMKGRGNYLCPRRLAAIRRRRPTNIDELRTFAKILVWLLESKTGDRSEISLRGAVENSIWQRLSAQDEDCTLQRCQITMKGTCPFYKARKTAEAANLLIINHALLVSDARAENRVLPEYQYAIVDEAHQLEDAVTDGLSVHIDQLLLLRRLADLGGPDHGLLGEVLKNIHGCVPDREFSRVESFVQTIGEAAALTRVHIENLFTRVYQFLGDHRNVQADDYPTVMRIDARHRASANFASMQTAWNTLDEFFEVVGDAMYRLTRALSRMEKYDVPGLIDLISSTETVAHHMEELRTQLTTFFVDADTDSICWISLRKGSDLPVIHTAPLHVGPLVEQYIWNDKEAVVMTGATLRAQDSFDYIQKRLFAESVEALDLGSPFDYRESTLVYIPDDIPEPNNRHSYQRALERGIIELADALNGRVLALFTSYTQLRQTAQAIAPRLALGNIVVYDQSDGTSRQALLDNFKTTEKAVLLGTRSFWEGIDIPGESLSALVIARLPFAVPSDPIFAARSETYSNAFNQFALPDAILRFRQGFGRLIRTNTDRGIVAIFDSRVLTRAYGASFLEALPDCTVRNGPLDALPEIAQHWIDLKK